MLCKFNLLTLFVFGISKGADDVNQNVLNETELFFTFIIFRHGDRTPVDRNLSYSNQPEALARIAEKYGYGQLTPQGKYRGYQIGQFIRSRYSSLLSPEYNKSEIYIRSTDITRAKMTVLTAMAAVYPPTDNKWSSDINWTPVPYSTVDPAKDFLMAYGNCPKYKMALANSSKLELPQFEPLFKKLSEISGQDVVKYPFLAYMLYDNYVCQNSLGLPLHEAVTAIWPEITEAAKAVMEATFGNEDYLNLLSGVLLDEFFKACSSLVKGKRIPRVRVYSTHDINVFAMIAASKIKKEARPGPPKFGAIYALELRKVRNSGQYVVLAIYVPDPNEEVILYLPIEGCNDIYCDLESFKNITSQFVLDEQAWRDFCDVNVAIPSILDGV